MNGIYLLAPAGIRLDTLVVNSVDISGFGQGMQTWRASSNMPFVINVVVSNSKFHNNAGAGVSLGGTAGATITGCESYLNGWNGPGFLFADSDLTTIINCNSHDNQGIGYTIAEGMTNSVISNCKSTSNYYAAYTVVAYKSNVNNGGGVNNVVIKDSSSYGDGNGYKFELTGIWTDGIVAATNVVFQNINAVITASGVATSFFSTSTSQFNALWLAGKFTMTTSNAVFTFPSVTYSADLTCDSSTASLCLASSSIPTVLPTVNPTVLPTSVPSSASINGATTYFVSSTNPSASDSNSGTASSAPWKTLAQVQIAPRIFLVYCSIRK